MTDDRLREAERVFRETGAVEDEARLLTERVRSGLLAPERLDLAAELRYEPAALAVGRSLGPTSNSLRRVMDGLARFGPDAVVRAALVVGRRCAASRPACPGTEDCFAAIEEWLSCPCDRHRRALDAWAEPEVDESALLAVLAVRGGDFVKTAERLAAPRAPEAALVAALRNTLVRQALAPHEPRDRRTRLRGSILDLTIGWPDQPETARVLAETERLRLSATAEDGIRLGYRAWECDVEIVRTPDGFDLVSVPRSRFTFVGGEPADERALATGDVISLAEVWLEVRAHEAPFAPEVEAARAHAARLLSRRDAPRGRDRIAAASAVGAPGGTLAALASGIPVVPRLDVRDVAAEVRRLPEDAAKATLLRLAREVDRVWPETLPGSTLLGRVLAALEPGATAPLDALRLELAATLGLVRSIAVEPRAFRAIAGLEIGLACLGKRMGVSSAALRAIDAGVPSERVRAIVREEVLRWALAD